MNNVQSPIDLKTNCHIDDMRTRRKRRKQTFFFFIILRSAGLDLFSFYNRIKQTPISFLLLKFSRNLFIKQNLSAFFSFVSKGTQIAKAKNGDKIENQIHCKAMNWSLFRETNLAIIKIYQPLSQSYDRKKLLYITSSLFSISNLVGLSQFKFSFETLAR